MNVRIMPGRVRGTAAAPPSKSYAHRLMICAALAEGTSTVQGISESEDMLATRDCIAALGAACRLEGDCLTVCGRGAASRAAPLFPCRESGSTLRFLIPAALVGGGEVRFTGTRRLMERGVGVYETLLREKGVILQGDADGITLRGALTPGEYTLPGDVSSQFVSGLLFALPLLAGDSTVRVLPPVESRGYIDITVDAMRAFGVTVTQPEPNLFHIPGGQRYAARQIAVEGDWSNAAALYAFGAAAPDTVPVTVTGLRMDSLQGDRVCLEHFARLQQPGAVVDIADCPDLGPVLFAVAAARHGAVFTGTRRLRIKESDRAAAMAEELAKCGITAVVEDNRVVILAGTLHAPDTPLDGHNDHRVVMAAAVLCSVVGGRITGVGAIRKSYPDFFDTLERLGLEVTYEYD